MTVSAQTPINRSTGNGVTTVFPYTFKIISEADIEVSVDDVVKTLTVDYTLSGVGADAGGNVTMTVAPASLTNVVRRRNMALVRTTDYQDQGELPASTLDSDIDATVLMIQQVDEQIGRALTLPAGVSGVSAELPSPVANGFFGWNVGATAIENKDLLSLGAVDGATLVSRTAATGSAIIPSGTTAERDATPVFGYQRANSTTGGMEWWNGTTWTGLGGGANNLTQANGVSVLAGTGQSLVGPITIPTGQNITVASGARLVVL